MHTQHRAARTTDAAPPLLCMRQPSLRATLLVLLGLGLLLFIHQELELSDHFDAASRVERSTRRPSGIGSAVASATSNAMHRALGDAESPPRVEVPQHHRGVNNNLSAAIMAAAYKRWAPKLIANRSTQPQNISAAAAAALARAKAAALVAQAREANRRRALRTANLNLTDRRLSRAAARILAQQEQQHTHTGRGGEPAPDERRNFARRWANRSLPTRLRLAWRRPPPSPPSVHSSASVNSTSHNTTAAQSPSPSSSPRAAGAPRDGTLGESEVLTQDKEAVDAALAAELPGLLTLWHGAIHTHGLTLGLNVSAQGKSGAKAGVTGSSAWTRKCRRFQVGRRKDFESSIRTAFKDLGMCETASRHWDVYWGEQWLESNEFTSEYIKPGALVNSIPGFRSSFGDKVAFARLHEGCLRMQREQKEERAAEAEEPGGPGP